MIVIPFTKRCVAESVAVVSKVHIAVTIDDIIRCILGAFHVPLNLAPKQ
jgi:hypothetical protein